MKQIKFILGALIAFQIVGCTDDLGGKYELPVSGEEIQFGAFSQGFSSLSRTVYGLPDGEDAHFGNYTALTISWLPGQDHVRVYSDVESECQSADYVVQTTTDAGEVLIKEGDTGVRWGNVNTTHNFYSFYPKERIIEGLETGTVVKANIPVAQEKGRLLMFDNDGKEITDGDAAPWKIIAPDMTYCMLAGKGTWSNESQDKTVKLTYTPLVSVLDVVINGPESTSYNIVSVSVRSKTQNIVGDFTYDINSGDFTYPTTKGDNKIATVSCIQGEGSSSKPITLNRDEKLNLKFFLLPQDIDASELSVSVLMEGGYVLTQNLSAEGNTSQGGDNVLAKGRISRIITPKIKEPATNNWMSLIGDNVYFAGLSLPGTRFSYTGSMTVPSGYNPDTDILQKYQSLYVATDGYGKTQFDAGIRAFDVDLICESSTDTPKVYAGTGVVNMPGTSTQMTIDNVLTALKNKVQPSTQDEATEGVLLFINYVNNYLSALNWITSVNNAISKWNNNNPGVLRSLGPTTTMGEMRGGIAVVVNLVNEGDDKPTLNLINYIDGYGTGRQDLEIKPYSYNGNSTVYVQKLMQVNNPQIKSDPNTYAWRQDIGLLPYYITEAVATGTAPTDVQVTENLLETKKLLMNKIIEQIKGDNGKSLFINDLSGFCVVQNDASTGYKNYKLEKCNYHNIYIGGWYNWDTYQGTTKTYDYSELKFDYLYDERPKADENSEGKISLQFTDDQSIMGNGGNPAAFSEEFNLIATEAIQEMVNTGRVPMGVVFINFAGEAEVDFNGNTYAVQGIRMPGLVMSNNFLFDLPEKQN